MNSQLESFLNQLPNEIKKENYQTLSILNKLENEIEEEQKLYKIIKIIRELFEKSFSQVMEEEEEQIKNEVNQKQEPNQKMVIFFQNLI